MKLIKFIISLFKKETRQDLLASMLYDKYFGADGQMSDFYYIKELWKVQNGKRKN